MKKRAIALMMMACIVVTTACSNEKDNNNKNTPSDDKVAVSTQNAKSSDGKYFKNLPSKLEDDEYIICTYPSNQEIYKELTMNAGFVFHILSTKELKQDDVKVTIDCKNKYTVIYNESEECKEKFDKGVCMMYNDTDWDKLKRLQMSDDKKDKEEFIEIDSSMNSEYSTLKDEQFPQYYDNKYTVQFEITDNYVNEEINSMTLNIKGKDYDIDIGKMMFYDGYDYGDVMGEGCNFSEIGRMQYDIYQNKEGDIEISDCELIADKDIVIKDIRIMNKDKNISLKEVNINSDVDGMQINQVWKKGDDIPVKSGESLMMNFIVQDKDFSGKECYGVNIYIVVEYELEGKTYASLNQTLCYTKYDSQTLYAMFKDKVDTKIYYQEYLAE